MMQIVSVAVGVLAAALLGLALVRRFPRRRRSQAADKITAMP
jgi:hypothetical protein